MCSALGPHSRRTSSEPAEEAIVADPYGGVADSSKGKRVKAKDSSLSIS